MNEQKQEQLKKVFQEHPEINEKLKEIGEKHHAEMQAKMTELLKEYGIELTEDDFKVPARELSEDELAAVSGGGGCGCFGGGSGKGDYLCCVCPIGGTGTIEGSQVHICEYGGCFCMAAGAGATNWGDVKPHPITEEEYKRMRYGSDE